MVAEKRSSDEILKIIKKANDEHDLLMKPKKIVICWPKLVTKKEEQEAKKKGKRFSLSIGYYLNMYFNITDGRVSRKLEEVLDKEDLDSENYAVVAKARYHYSILMGTAWLEKEQLAVVSFYCTDLALSRGETYAPRIIGEMLRIYIDGKKRCYVKERTSYGRWDYTHVKLKKSFAEASVSDLSLMRYYLLEMGKSNGYESVFGQTYEEISAPILKLFPCLVRASANHTLRMTDPLNWDTFLRYREPKPKKGKKGSLIEELTSKYPLDDIDYDPSLNRNVAFIEKVDEGIAVLRTMENSTDVGDKMLDKARVYVVGKEFVACRPTNIGEWVSMPMKASVKNWIFEVPEFDPETVKGTKLEYFSLLIKNASAESRGVFITSLLAYPWLEAMAKSPLICVIEDILKNKALYGKFTDSIERYFGPINQKAKRLNDIVGMNKHQIDVFAKWFSTGGNKLDFCSLIHKTKIIFLKDKMYYYYYHSYKNDDVLNISHVDNDSFDSVFNALLAVHEKASKEGTYYSSNMVSNFTDALIKIKTTYSFATMMAQLDNTVELSNKFYTTTSSYASWSKSPLLATKHYVMRLICDYYSMVKDMDGQKYFRPNFNPDDVDQIRDMHDACVAVYNASSCHKSIYTRSSYSTSVDMDSLRKKWKRFTYSEDGLAVVAPENLGEIAMEGITLHHCAKSYVEKVANQETNVLFLRKTDSLDEPYYTLEVDNYNQVLQISGFCNYFPSGKTDILDFVYRWCKAKRLKYRCS